MLTLKRTVCVAALICFSAMSFFVEAGSTTNVYQYKVGNFSITAVLDSSFYMESSLLKNGNADIIKKYMPEGKLLCSDNVYIIKTKKQTVLIDAGISGNLDSKIVKAGISPDSVNLVLITHGHYDHVAGLVKNGKAVFQNAKILFSDREKQLYGDSAIEKVPAEYKQFFLPANQVLKIYGSKVETFSFGKQITEGIVSVDMNGHTSGHAGYMVESEGQKILFAGDFLHIGPVQFPHPEISLVFDSDINQAVSMRKQILNKLSKEKIPVAAMHVQFPGIGHVKSGTEGYVIAIVK